jgi:hypothetical protein
MRLLARRRRYQHGRRAARESLRPLRQLALPGLSLVPCTHG